MKQKVLVTGGSGFLGSQIILQLLQQGYEVKTTVRSKKSEEHVKSLLKQQDMTELHSLTFIKADLSKDENWELAMKDCTYVLSVASPVFFEIPKNEEEAIRPAVDGILRVLKMAKKMKVKKVVMTSNFGAIGFSKKKSTQPTTEEDWTSLKERGLSIYEKSKLIAERTAWKFIEEEGNGLDLTTINPVAILGPSLSPHVSNSFVLLDMLFKDKWAPQLPLNIVDVRDVADLHIRAMTSEKANGQRFIASCDGQISLFEMAEIIRKERPNLAKKLQAKKIPNWLIQVSALFNQRAKEGALMLSINRNISNQKAKEQLGWQPLGTNKKVLLATIDSMEKYGLL
ncbi:hypothetical protein BH747_09380 [Enterococcus villorum]|uniref:NAD-dependent epimerase/dehydratase domain-containing protein n=1 Tax=Enterococcus villorum TaxID=112904 RepID=A0A1V8YAY1_9ENTE|nr:NAD-dependent epimerase/dehydratase family protein [Enterococcus villorum]OQO69760.1 hypothetical protein BH747_09380 [Enterococcus villorum]OQO74923.1 hypothetical protein BH744_06510 [Enterococcus villorum]